MCTGRNVFGCLVFASVLLGGACGQLNGSGGKDERDDSDADAARRDGGAGGETLDERGGSNTGGRRAVTDEPRGGRGSDAGSGGDSGESPPTMLAGDGSLTCAEEVPDTATVVSEDPGGDTTWSGAIHVTTSIKVRNAGKLTIQPGTQIFVEPDAQIELGWAGNENILDARGTPANPIRFCRAERAGAAWGGLALRDTVSSSSVLQYTVIEGAGAGEGAGGAALVMETGVLVDHVWVRESAGVGVVASDFRDGSAELTVAGSAGAALVLSGPGAVHRLPLGGELAENAEPIAHVSFHRLDAATRFREIGIPYQLDEGLIQATGGDLTVDPGVELRVGVDKTLEMGWAGGEAEVHIVGTAAAPIVIRGAEARQGSWQGLLIEDTVYSTSILEHVKIQHGGGTDGSALSIIAPITARDLTFEGNAHEAFFIGAQGLAPESARFTVEGTKGLPGRIVANALTTLPAGGSYAGNELDYIAVDGGGLSRSGTIPKVDVPLRVLGDIQLRDGARIEIAAGAEFEMQSGVLWDVGWAGSAATVMAIGTSADPIVFRGVDERPGFWSGVAISSTVTADSKLEHVHIGNAGDASLGAALALSSPITVESCKLWGSASYGLSAPADYTQDYESANTFEANASGAVLRK